MKVECFIAGAALACASLVPAQPVNPPGQFPYQPTNTPGQPTPLTPAQIVAQQVARLTALLSLTSAEQTQAKTIFTAEVSTLTTIQSSETTLLTTLRTAIEADDLSAITAASAQIGTLTTQAVQAGAAAEAGFYQLLTPSQQAIYKQLVQYGFGLGFGGPFGPGQGGRY